MKKLLLSLLLSLPAWGVTVQRAQGWCEAGNVPVQIGGLSSTNVVQGSYPACLVTVNVHLGGLATIYANSSLTPLSNPFHGSIAGIWFFYASSPAEYDITLCSDVAANNTCNGPLAAFTIYDVYLTNGSGGGGGAVNSFTGNQGSTRTGSVVAITGDYSAIMISPSPYSVTYSPSPTFDLSQGDLQILTLQGDALTPMFINSIAGLSYRIKICQDSFGNHNFTFPSNFTGQMAVGFTANKCSIQRFTAEAGPIFEAEAPGIINQ
jgi:hypothetical protein